jgi:hypothetical protein
MIFGWRQRRRDARAKVERDATRLMQEFGERAYYVARDRALAARCGEVIDANRDADHWDRVRAEIGKCTNRVFVDTATRFIEDR